MSAPLPTAPGPEAETNPIPPAAAASPHTGRYVVLRILGAVLIAAVALAVNRLWLEGGNARETFGAKVRTKEIDSAAIGRQMPVKVVVPKGAPSKGRSLVVFLHGRGEDERSYLVDPMFEALSDLRTRAPVIAFPYGGESSYWHNRSSGEWASYVLDEVIPQLVERFDVDPSKIAIGGISMGGFGAYDIARMDPERFCAVAGHSPAIWTSAGDAADGAFDDAADFAANDVITSARSPADPYSGLHLWLDAGTEDPFLDGDKALEEALRAAGDPPVVQSSSGGHDNAYWNGNWDEYLGWYAHVLRQCGTAAAAERRRARTPAERKAEATGAGAQGSGGAASGSSGPSSSAAARPGGGAG